MCYFSALKCITAQSFEASGIKRKPETVKNR